MSQALKKANEFIGFLKESSYIEFAVMHKIIEAFELVRDAVASRDDVLDEVEEWFENCHCSNLSGEMDKLYRILDKRHLED